MTPIERSAKAAYNEWRRGAECAHDEWEDLPEWHRHRLVESMRAAVRELAVEVPMSVIVAGAHQMQSGIASNQNGNWMALQPFVAMLREIEKSNSPRPLGTLRFLRQSQ